jgi:hypothetical protein
MVKIKLSLINADLPQDRIEVCAYGYGIDPQDKGVGKAVSYASKMALLKCFMLETGEDPEKANEDYKPDTKGMVDHIYELESGLPPERQDAFHKWIAVQHKTTLDNLNAVVLKEITLKLEAEVRKSMGGK